MRFRDRDAPVTPEGLIFRTYGYDHPAHACFCDLEYAPETVYRTRDPRAVREGATGRYYKFYLDGGLRFAAERFPRYRLRHRALNRLLVGVKENQLAAVTKPDERLREVLATGGDPLVEALREVLDLISDSSSLRPGDFGVFGSIAHGFHHPRHSDIDLVIYGKKELRELRNTLAELYRVGPLRNEFDGWTAEMPPRHWNLRHYPKEEYGWYQRRKLIYAAYPSAALGRVVKVEFEPVRKWTEVDDEYRTTRRIESLGPAEAVVEVLSDDEAGFMPSVYPVELKAMDREIQVGDLKRVVSFMEEFRLQLMEGEEGTVRGDLELVETDGDRFSQITLSRSPDYFGQVMKLTSRR